uniref:ALK and LTK ligand 1 n=2 Tax=Poecilia mexicana TaxID=48701 RepID=A0A3B3WR41_9TELE
MELCFLTEAELCLVPAGPVMLLPRTSVRSALLILLLLFILLQTPGRCQAAARHRGSAPQAEARRGRHSLAQLVARYRRGPVGFSGHEAAGPKRPSRSNHEGRLSDPKHKEKFITHLTGPLYFKPQCRKQFHRLYNNTRDCTVPAFYKRCARLLTQLAKSPRCAER